MTPIEKTSKSETPKEKGKEKGKEKTAPTPANATKTWAVVRMRGTVRIAPAIAETLVKLNICRVNYCTLLHDAPNLHGMLQKAKDYITWGEASPDTIKALEKKAEPDPRDPRKKKPFFRLNPPRGGYGRKGIKTSFNQSGASGYRGEKINHLIQRMLM